MTTKLKLRSTARFLASIFSGIGTKVRVDSLARYIDIDYTDLPNASDVATIDQNHSFIAIQSDIDGVVGKIRLADLTNTLQSQRVITVAGDVTVGVNDFLIILFKGVAENTNFIMPKAADKVGSVKIVDWSGIGGSNSLIVVPNGAETINGQASWQIGQGASITLNPINSGLGYAV